MFFHRVLIKKLQAHLRRIENDDFYLLFLFSFFTIKENFDILLLNPTIINLTRFVIVRSFLLSKDTRSNSSRERKLEIASSETSNF